MIVVVLFYRCELRTVTTKQKNKIQVSEIASLRGVERRSRVNCKGGKDIRGALRIYDLKDRFSIQTDTTVNDDGRDT